MCALVPLKPNELTPARRRRRSAPTACRRRHDDRHRVSSRCADSGAANAGAAESPALQRQHGLDQSGDAGGGLEMPDVRLDASRSSAAASASRPAPSTAASAFTSIGSPKRSAGAVRLDVADICAAGSAPAQRCADHGLLGRAIRRGQAVAATVLIDRAAADQRQNPIAVARASRRRLQHDHAAAFAAHVAVGRSVECLAAPVAAPSCPPCEKLTFISGVRIRLTPPASARSHSPLRRPWQARCTATSDDEQAVSTAMPGPAGPADTKAGRRRR